MKVAVARIVWCLLLLWGTTGLAAVQAQALGEGVNTDLADESCPVVGPENEEIYFARANHRQNFGQENLADIWMAARSADGSWGHAVNLGALVNSPSEDYPIAVVQNSSLLYLASNRYGAEFPMLYRSKREGRLWDLAEPVVIEDHYSYDPRVRYAVSFDGEVCLLAADRDESVGGLDLFVAFRQGASDLYSFPRPLGEQINTGGHETSPFLSSDGLTLYFIRQVGETESGQLYRSVRQDDSWQNWSEPEPVDMEKVSFPAFSFFLSFDGRNTYLSQGTPADIYRKTFVERQQSRPMLHITGRVEDARTGRPLRASLELMDPIGNLQKEVRTLSGEYEFIVPRQEGMMLQARATGYLPIIRWISFAEPEREEVDFGDGNFRGSESPGGMVINSPQAERIEMWLQRLETDLRKLEEKRKRQYENKPPQVPELERQEVLSLRQKYESRFYAASSEKQDRPSRSFPSNAEQEEQKTELESMKEKFARYARTDEAGEAAEPHPADNRPRLDMPFEEVLGAAHWEVLQALAPEYIVKLREQIMDVAPLQIESRLSEHLQGRMRMDDWLAVSERLFFYAPVSLGRRNPTDLSFLFASEELQAFWQDLLAAIEGQVRSQIEGDLLPQLRKELRQELEYQVYLQLETILKNELESLLMEKLQQRRTVGGAGTSVKGGIPPSLREEVNTIRLDLSFVPAEEGQTFELRTAHFRANQTNLLPGAIRSLDQLAALLKAYPRLQVRIGVHTNTEVDPSYARALTQLRADAIVDYLLRQGLAESRLSGQGYGNAQPLVNGRGQDDHLRNQRVEIEIVAW